MSDAYLARAHETPTLEVLVLRDGDLVHRELCESEEEAAIAVEAWADVDDVTVEVHGLSDRERAADTSELDLRDVAEDGYGRDTADSPSTAAYEY